MGRSLRELFDDWREKQRRYEAAMNSAGLRPVTQPLGLRDIDAKVVTNEVIQNIHRLAREAEEARQAFLRGEE